MPIIFTISKYGSHGYYSYNLIFHGGSRWPWLTDIFLRRGHIPTVPASWNWRHTTVRQGKLGVSRHPAFGGGRQALSAKIYWQISIGCIQVCMYVCTSKFLTDVITIISVSDGLHDPLLCPKFGNFFKPRVVLPWQTIARTQHH